MIEGKGKYNTARIFTDNIEPKAMAQIIELCSQEFAKESKIRIMPDCHSGKGCIVGTTMTVQDKVVANLVGADIGCGMEVISIDRNKTEVNFDQLDDTIRKHIPHGFDIRSHAKRHPLVKKIAFQNIHAPFNLERAMRSIGTLGKGNHFLEVNEMDDHIVLVIHSGSHSLGKDIAEHYQKRAYERLLQARAEGQSFKLSKEFAYIQGQDFTDYMNDMEIAQYYAIINRMAMADEIITRMGWKITDRFTTIHNYIDMDNMILRKGAISAQKGERVIIPINMRDGSLIAVGKGNPDWNYSGPHGAGRLMSRSQAKENVSLEEYQESMKGIWTTSVNQNTLDESPMAYKSIDEIMENTQDAVEITNIIKPLYNFKSN